jgi:hypothetical protein
MRSSELRARLCLLRDDVEQLRAAVRRPAGRGARSKPIPPGLLRDVARQAREVEAWGAELFDPCALAAAQEAYLVLLQAEWPATGPTRSKTVGAVVVLQCRHPVDVDRAQLVGLLKAGTLDALVAGSPCPMEVTVGLLPIEVTDDMDVDVPADVGDTQSTTIPLLVALRCPWTERVERLLGHVHRTVMDSRTTVELCGPNAFSVATLPVPHRALGHLARRCEGELLSSAGARGDSAAEGA